MLLRTTTLPTPSPIRHSSPLHTQAPPALTAEQTAIVKSTAPVLEEHGNAITSHFYKRILAAVPELRNVFNAAHQQSGEQQSALARAVWGYAAHIDDLDKLSSTVSRIGHKHAGLGVAPEHYPIVGEHLLASIQEVLGDGVNATVMEAWAAAYAQLANIFINFEKGLYDAAASTPGGWNGWRSFVVEQKTPESGEITSFHLAPHDGGPLPPFRPGQFVTIRCFVPGLNLFQPRQYSLSAPPGSSRFRISVKRESAGADRPAGHISSLLHDGTPAGAVLDLSMPYGDFTLDAEATTPVVLLSGGVGLTPMISMLQTITSTSSDRKVHFVHAARNRNAHAMRDELASVVAGHANVSRAVYYDQVGEGDVKGVDYDFEGRVEFAKTEELVEGADYYICGPVPFMARQRADLERLGVEPGRIHSEVFGAA
jgi:ferredoxin-NADP reductase/hemoglobin-like flavoprotein